ncbi:MAG: sodium:solute symporter family protein [Candidatus Zixiibacteriota bacterium]|nr:MAG: sodium:solute symporter family protein [candidate division Zixibacteria bacterium]
MAGALDYTLIGIYLIFLVAVGFRQFLKGKKTVDEYLVMGRRLALPGFVASLVSTWYGGILGVGEYSFRYGLSNWVVFGLPYYLGAFLFAMFLAKKARSANLYTIPDQLDRTYGRSTSLAGALLVFVTTIPAAYILQLGFLAESIAGIPLAYGVIGGAFFSISYVLTGGLRNDVITDRAQFILMFSGFIIMLIFLSVNYGGLSFISANVPDKHLSLGGGRPITYILVWYFIALGTLVDPAFYQRCFAAKSEAVAKKGIFIAIAFWAFFDFMTTSTGLYARALLPDLTDPATSYPMLAFKVLPGFFRAVFLLGLFATVMSTIDSFTLVAGQTIGKDFIHRIWGRDAARMTQIGIILAGLLAIVIALFKRSIVAIWYDLGSISTASLLIPLASSFGARWRMSREAAFFSIIFSGLVVVAWMGLGSIYDRERFLDIDPIYPGLFCSIMFFLFDKYLFSRDNYK